MDEKKIEELAIVMAERYGVSETEAALVISGAMQVALSLKEAIAEVAKRLAVVVSQLWVSVKECIEQLENERYNRNRQAWATVWDTRKQSQVISNKPRFMVRKIIG